MKRIVEPVMPPQRRDRWLVVALFAATLLVYWPSLFGGFLWDDDGHVTQPHLRSFDGLVKIWTEPAATQQYYPLLHSAFWLEYKLWGDHAFDYRLLNVLLHATSACLFAALLRRLAVPGAWLAAFIFALHPVCVESVAWIAEQKNTLSLVFYLSAALAYLRFDENRRPAAYLLATGFFVAALLSKTVTVTLPAALVVILTWKKRGLIFRRDVLPLLLWVALGFGAGIMTIWNERTLIGARGTHFDLTFAEHILLPGRIIWFYLGKLFWPANLAFFYPRWTLDSSQFWQWLFPFACVACTAVLVWRKSLRVLLVPWLLFVGTLFPALGFFNVYPFVFSYVADHFQYHASLGIVAAAAAGLTMLMQRLPRRATLVVTFALPLALGLLAFQQGKIYLSNTALYEDTLAKNPDCWLARNNLGQIFTDKGELEKAIPYFQRALQLRPEFAEAENNLGYALRQLGRVGEAIPHFERAIALQPKYAQAHNNLGLAYVLLGDRERAIACFHDATRSHPRFPTAHFNLGLTLAQIGKTQEALLQFQRALQLDPAHASSELNWAIGLMQLGRFPEAIAHFEKAIQLAPDSIPNHLTYSRALARNGRFNEAIDQCRAALEIDPDCLDAHVGLANMFKQIGRLSDADYHFREAQRLQSAGAKR
ncbi:MAG: tetratricopeptide repeat protein [Nibricoccus sp.]